MNLQVLLDGLEEQLNLPARLINIRNGFGRQIETVGQKHIIPAGVGIVITHAAQALRCNAFLVCAVELDDLIRGNALTRDHDLLQHLPVHGAGLLPRHEIHALCG